MGLEKLAQTTATWVKASGKSSILQTKALRKDIVTNELGACLSNGSIKFQSENGAVKYIINRLKDSLNFPQEKQFERLIVKKGTAVLGEVNGNNNSVPLSKVFNIKGVTNFLHGNKPRILEVYHSHPDLFGKGKTAPLSSFEGDISTFYNLNLKKIVAVNSNGEINSLEIGKSFTPGKYKLFKDGYEDFLGRKIDKNLWEELNNIEKTCKKYMEQNKEVPATIKEKYEKVAEKFMEAQNNAIKTEKYALIDHEYYKKANDFGLKYETNFSNLIGKRV